MILAGGEGVRLGRVDKALLSLAGRPMLEHVLGRFAPQVTYVGLSTNAPAEHFSGFDVSVFADNPNMRGLGPLAGIWAALDWAYQIGAKTVATVSIDTPFIPINLVPRLITAGAPAVAASQTQVHPTVALWHVSQREQIHAQIESGDLRLSTAVMDATIVEFDGGGSDPFLNINRPADLHAAEVFLRGGAR
ncbi:molybdenum cofactor guanylyltransferase [Thioclava sp. SK-1]|uniref:molybdenum cofactor guanylyltransferase n=1 Tax=Thioclava sp. SK-1 TaxID=1889770 RepID=UPI00159F259E|nr:molybdenum cofactor guanylyltransferase [Thioclava sp. SK-1]